MQYALAQIAAAPTKRTAMRATGLSLKNFASAKLRSPSGIVPFFVSSNSSISLPNTRGRKRNTDELIPRNNRPTEKSLQEKNLVINNKSIGMIILAQKKGKLVETA